jgi:hypothetical protein
MKVANYLECQILGRKWYVTKEDIGIFAAITANVNGTARTFSELGEEEFIVRVIWERKRARMSQLKMQALKHLPSHQPATPAESEQA